MTQEQRARIADDLRGIIFVGEPDEEAAGQLIDEAVQAGALSEPRYAGLRQAIRKEKRRRPNNWGDRCFDLAAVDLFQGPGRHHWQHLERSAQFIAGLIDGRTPLSEVSPPDAIAGIAMRQVEDAIGPASTATEGQPKAHGTAKGVSLLDAALILTEEDRCFQSRRKTRG